MERDRFGILLLAAPVLYSHRSPDILLIFHDVPFLLRNEKKFPEQDYPYFQMTICDDNLHSNEFHGRPKS